MSPVTIVQEVEGGLATFDTHEVRLPPTRLCIAVPQLWEQVSICDG